MVRSRLLLAALAAAIGSPQIVERGELTAAGDQAPGWWPSAFLGYAARRLPELVAGVTL